MLITSNFFSYQGSNKKRNHLNQRVKKPDYKVAYVQLVSVVLFGPTLEGCIVKVIVCS